MNPLYNDLVNNGNSLLKQFEKFKSSFTGDPKAQVQALLDSGRMSQNQFNQLSKMADDFMKMMKG